MLLTVITAFPLLAMVNVPCAEAPTVTLPKDRFPLKAMTRVGATVPVPEVVVVLTPLVLSELTVTVPP